MNCNCSESRTQRTIEFENNDRRRRLFAEEFTPTGLNAHDCIYIMRRNEVLNQAERIALKAAGVRHGPGWQQAFSKAVDELSNGG